jgi:hypothetical protein
VVDVSLHGRGREGILAKFLQVCEDHGIDPVAANWADVAVFQSPVGIERTVDKARFPVPRPSGTKFFSALLRFRVTNEIPCN